LHYAKSLRSPYSEPPAIKDTFYELKGVADHLRQKASKKGLEKARALETKEYYLARTRSKPIKNMESVTMENKNGWGSFGKITAKISEWAVDISAAFLGITVLFSLVDIVSSKWFGRGIPASGSFIEQFMVIQIFLAIGFITLERGHITLNMLDRVLPIKLIFGFRAFGYFAGMFLSGWMTWQTGSYELSAFRVRELTGITTSALIVPVWWVNIFVVIGFFLLFLGYLFLFGKTLIDGPKVITIASPE
jgi:TRAP-type C4-dicarboxylate transport system permease small subunit